MKTKELSILLTNKKEVKSINKALKKYFPKIEELDIDLVTNYHKAKLKEGDSSSVLLLKFDKTMSDLSVSREEHSFEHEYLLVDEAIEKLEKINAKKEKRCQN